MSGVEGAACVPGESSVEEGDESCAEGGAERGSCARTGRVWQWLRHHCLEAVEAASVNLQVHMCSYGISDSFMHVLCMYIQAQYRHICICTEMLILFVCLYVYAWFIYACIHLYMSVCAYVIPICIYLYICTCVCI